MTPRVVNQQNRAVSLALSIVIVLTMNTFAVIVLAITATVNGFTAHNRQWMPRSVKSTSSLSMSAGGVVITGGANGVGFAYAGEFMDRGYNVVICDIQDATTAAKSLAARHPNGKIYHTKCDVSDSASVQKLGQFAVEKLGTVNYWINNAGINGGRRSLREVPFGMVEAVVKVNLLGILYCTKVAMDIMAEQVSNATIHNELKCREESNNTLI